MSDENQNTESTPQASEPKDVESTSSTEAPASDTKNDEHTVPVSALTKEREKAAAKITELEDKLAQVAQAEEERKRAELDEVERAKLEAQEATAKAEQLQQALVQEQRKQVALAAASTAGFRDPSDALPFVDLTGDVSSDDIVEAVGKVLETKPYLKAEAPKGPAQTSGVEDGSDAKKEETGADAIGSILSSAQKLVGG